jgi:hypothetical protein
MGFQSDRGFFAMYRKCCALIALLLMSTVAEAQTYILNTTPIGMVFFLGPDSSHLHVASLLPQTGMTFLDANFISLPTTSGIVLGYPLAAYKSYALFWNQQRGFWDVGEIIPIFGPTTPWQPPSPWQPPLAQTPLVRPAQIPSPLVTPQHIQSTFSPSPFSPP